MKRLFFILSLFASIITTGCNEKEDIVEGSDNEIVSEDRIIRYTTTDNVKLFPYNTEPSRWGAILISNTYENGEGVLTFDDTITSIGVDAFYGCETLATITIPKSVKSIEEVAFGGCTNLSEVHISDLAAWCQIDFDNNPLYYAHNLYLNDVLVENVVIPEDVKEIKRRVFEGAICIKKVVLHDGITRIEEMAFYDCTSLDNINIPSSVESVGYNAFHNCASLPILDNIRYADTYLIEAIDKTQASYSIQDGVRFIAENAFNDCRNVEELSIPESVCSIGEEAFLGCQNLTTINIPQTITRIEQATFSGCKKLTGITIPQSVTSIGYGAFAACNSLTRVDITDLSAWCNISFGENWSNPLQSAHNLYVDGELVTHLVIPNDITAISNSIFEGGFCFESIDIPEGVTKIGRYAFCNCPNIRSVTIPSTVVCVEHGAFETCTQLAEVFCPSTTPPQMDGLVFMDCASELVIYVPSESVDAYRTAVGWMNYADMIVGMDFE